MGISRRDWLRISSAAGASLAFPGWAAILAKEPAQQLVRSADPLNTEPPLPALVAAAVTPVAQFYVRNHGPMPKLDAQAVRLRVEGLVHKPLELSVAELTAQFKAHKAEATLTCAGNRRQEMSAIKATPGVQWDAGAIGNAQWGGVLLADVLKAAELKDGAKHVWFEGHDEIKEKDHATPFGGSIPLEKALAKSGPALLAHKMNDEPLTAEHGFPLRTVVPGYIGARSVKWLAKIVVSDRPSPNHYLAKAYKVIQHDDPAEIAAAKPIYEYPLNAAICTPGAGAKLPAGKVAVTGYALASGADGSRIAKVEVSADGGKSWQPADLASEAAPLCWQLWKANLELPAGKHELVVRASDTSGQDQPKTGEWNLKGYLFNGWHRVGVELA
jgi:sulfite oxidase